MRRFCTAWVVAAATLIVPCWARAGNQEVAEHIAANLRNSGQLSDYHVSVKCQDGTVWLEGQVHSADQMKNAEKVAFDTPGVTRVINHLSITSETGAAEPQKNAIGKSNPLRRTPPVAMGASADNGHAEQVASSFTQTPAQRTTATEPLSVGDKASRQAVYQMVSVPGPNGTRQIVPVAMLQAGPGVASAPAAPEAVAPGTGAPISGAPLPMYSAAPTGQVAPARLNQPYMPSYAWPSYASYPNYAAVTYPKQYSPTAWPYIGPFYPYPQVPLGWRKVTLQWDDGWWMLDFKDEPSCIWWR